MEQQELIEKIKRLPQDRIADVAAFIDSLSRDPDLDRAALHQALSDYASRYAGTNADLDPDQTPLTRRLVGDQSLSSR